eukprot:s1694_g18.t1
MAQQQVDAGVFEAALLQIAEATQAAAKAAQAAASSCATATESGAGSSGSASDSKASVDWSKCVNRPPVFDYANQEQDQRHYRDWLWQLTQYLAQLLRLEDAYEETSRAGAALGDEVKTAILLRCVTGALKTHLSFNPKETSKYQEEHFVCDPRDSPKSTPKSNDGRIRVLQYSIGDDEICNSVASGQVRAIVSEMPDDVGNAHNILLDSGADGAVFPALLGGCGSEAAEGASRLHDTQGSQIQVDSVRDVAIHLLDQAGKKVHHDVGIDVAPEDGVVGQEIVFEVAEQGGDGADVPLTGRVMFSPGPTDQLLVNGVELTADRASRRGGVAAVSVDFVYTKAVPDGKGPNGIDSLVSLVMVDSSTLWNVADIRVAAMMLDDDVLCGVARTCVLEPNANSDGRTGFSWMILFGFIFFCGLLVFLRKTYRMACNAVEDFGNLYTDVAVLESLAGKLHEENQQLRREVDAMGEQIRRPQAAHSELEAQGEMLSDTLDGVHYGVIMYMATVLQQSRGVATGEDTDMNRGSEAGGLEEDAESEMSRTYEEDAPPAELVSNVTHVHETLRNELNAFLMRETFQDAELVQRCIMLIFDSMTGAQLMSAGHRRQLFNTLGDRLGQIAN